MDLVEQRLMILAIAAQDLLTATEDGLNDILSVNEWDFVRSLAAYVGEAKP